MDRAKNTRRVIFALYILFVLCCVYWLYQQWFGWPQEIEAGEVCGECGAELS